MSLIDNASLTWSSDSQKARNDINGDQHESGISYMNLVPKYTHRQVKLRMRERDYLSNTIPPMILPGQAILT